MGGSGGDPYGHMRLQSTDDQQTQLGATINVNDQARPSSLECVFPAAEFTSSTA